MSLGFECFSNHIECFLLAGLPPGECGEERERPEEEEAGILWLHPAILRLPQRRAPSGHVQTGTGALAGAHVCFVFAAFFFFFTPPPTTHSFPGGGGVGGE